MIPNSFPAIKLTADEAPWFDLAETNTGVVLDPLPECIRPLALLPYPPGVPSMAAYEFALASQTFKEMERFSAAFLDVNRALVNQYSWSRDPLHAWSRKYEYAWHAEVLRAMMPPSHARLLATTWPFAPAPVDIEFSVLDAGSGFTFYDQFIGSRLGVRVVALDQDASYVPLFSGLSKNLLVGERDVSPVPYVLAKIERTGFPAASFDAISCVSVLEHVHDEELQLTVKEFKRILKRGARLLFTFDTGQPPIAKNAAQSARLLAALRTEMVEDTTHGAPLLLLARDDGAAQALFTNRKASPPEFVETVFSISCHVFINY